MIFAGIGFGFHKAAKEQKRLEQGIAIKRMKNMWEMFCCRKRIPMHIFIGTKIMEKWNVIFFQITTYQLLVGKLLQKQMQSFDSELPKKALCVVQENIKSDMLFPER